MAIPYDEKIYKIEHSHLNNEEDFLDETLQQYSSQKNTNILKLKNDKLNFTALEISNELEIPPIKIKQSSNCNNEDKISYYVKKNKKKNYNEGKKITKKGKRGPGRPRKLPVKEPKKKMGIGDMPHYDSDNIIELVYCSPLIMKKIFSFFIGHSETIQCKFKKDKVDIMCQDKFGINKIKVTMNGHLMHKYFCKEPLEFGMSLAYLEPLHKKLRKQFTELVWFSEEDEKDRKTHIWLKWEYYKDAWNKNDYSLAGQYIKLDEKIFDIYTINDYPITFTLQHKIFKDIIDDASNHGDTIYIRQYGKENPLCIDYQPELSRFESSNPFTNLEEIKLVSNIKKNEVFSVAIRIENLKSVASTIPSEEIEFKVSKSKPLIITSYLDDKSVTVKVLIDIIIDK